MFSATLIWRAARQNIRLAISLALLAAVTAASNAFEFEAEEPDIKLDVGLAVRLVDINGDSLDDILIVDSKRIIWLQNPDWTEHVLIEDHGQPMHVDVAPYDIDQDGKLDFALCADLRLNEGGTIEWFTVNAAAHGLRPFSIAHEPTVHRIQFADVDGDGRSELIALPLYGRNTTKPYYAENGVRMLALRIPDDPVGGRWEREVVTDALHVSHGFQPVEFDGDPGQELLAVSFEGVSLLDPQRDGVWQRTLIGMGDQQSSPNRGASEVAMGRFQNGSRYIATIEPWHGHQVVVYTEPDDDKLKKIWQRRVIDDQLKWGHAVRCINLDDDDDEELVVGVRDDDSASNRCGIRIYDPRPSDNWIRHEIDPGSVAVENLAVGDLNRDGRADIIAVGRATRNVRLYWNRTP